MPWSWANLNNIVVKCVDMIFIFAKIKIKFHNRYTDCVNLSNSLQGYSIETSHRERLDSFEPSASLQCDLHQRFTFVNFKKLENTISDTDRSGCSNKGRCSTEKEAPLVVFYYYSLWQPPPLLVLLKLNGNIKIHPWPFWSTLAFCFHEWVPLSN